jgi:hypothetical protein
MISEQSSRDVRVIGNYPDIEILSNMGEEDSLYKNWIEVVWTTSYWKNLYFDDISDKAKNQHWKVFYQVKFFSGLIGYL